MKRLLLLLLLAPMIVDAAPTYLTGPRGPPGPTPTGSGNKVLATPVDGSSGQSALRALVVLDLPTAAVTISNGGTITAKQGYYIATGGTTFTLPATAVGKEFCFRQETGGTNLILITPPASSYVEAADGSAYCTVSHAIRSSGANGDQICMVATDATHWKSMNVKGVWACQ